ncbi:hypothetical protein K469DRAFT_261692 [Zopfia rhizophila CBS 207.26]|uniref:Uncharacterized protein n=1 Tax=Zopfia rhizophila CBS 207.26 TaxID=1314779 RepID=A0A6A6DNZ8_9PEZI|nr:hypothetical protein K469DRAFT_261692 [Zopfia rhizophila CBS 207.26]
MQALPHKRRCAQEFTASDPRDESTAFRPKKRVEKTYIPRPTRSGRFAPIAMPQRVTGENTALDATAMDMEINAGSDTDSISRLNAANDRVLYTNESKLSTIRDASDDKSKSDRILSGSGADFEHGTWCEKSENAMLQLLLLITYEETAYTLDGLFEGRKFTDRMVKLRCQYLAQEFCSGSVKSRRQADLIYQYMTKEHKVTLKGKEKVLGLEHPSTLNSVSPNDTDTVM